MSRPAGPTIALIRCSHRIASEGSGPCRSPRAGPSLPESERQAVVGQSAPNCRAPERALARPDNCMGTIRTQNSFGCGRRCQRFELIQGDRDSRAFRLADEIRLRNGDNPLQMDFQQAPVSDIETPISRIHVHDRFVGCGIVDPGEGMRRYGLACCCHMEPGKRSESRKIDPARSRCEIEARVGRGRIGIDRGAINNVFANVAAHPLIAAISANTGIATRAR